MFDRAKESVEVDDTRSETLDSEDPAGNATGMKLPVQKEKRVNRIQIWTEVRPSLGAIEDMMNVRVKKKNNILKTKLSAESGKLIPPIEEARSPKGASDEDSEDEFYDVEKSESSDAIQDGASSDSLNTNIQESAIDSAPPESSVPWKEELQVLVRGGVPMALRGEVSHFTL